MTQIMSADQVRSIIAECEPTALVRSIRPCHLQPGVIKVDLSGAYGPTCRMALRLARQITARGAAAHVTGGDCQVSVITDPAAYAASIRRTVA